MAEYVEVNERAKEAASTELREAQLNKIAEAHLHAHGEEMSASAREKLAKTDLDTLGVVENLLVRQASELTPLGAGAEREAKIPTTTKEAADAASDRFLSWITS